VLRILDRSNLPLDFASLGFDGDNLARYLRVLRQPHGIVLVTGPTGSGKTTTLYASLSAMNSAERKILTIEDPIEYRLAGVNQTQVNPQIGLTFAAALRSFLRQDPDVMMVGEIRDLETAEMAIQAALTGHLVFSTLHTNDSVSAVTRLIDLGVAPYLIGSTVIGVLAQRLVRTLCVNCKQPDEGVTREKLDEVVKPWRLNGAVKPYKPVGCLECRMTGYRGRAGLYELLTLTDAARAAIHPVTDATRLRQQALADGLRPLRLAGAMKVAEGVSTLDEVLRATPSWES
jgi:general secretion pathway protein E